MEFACKAWYSYREEIGPHGPAMKRALRAIIIPLMLRDTSNTYKLINSIKSLNPVQFLTHMYKENNVKTPKELIDIIKDPENWEEITRQMVIKEKFASARKKSKNKLATGFNLINDAKNDTIEAKKFFATKPQHQRKNKIKAEFKELKEQIADLEKILKDMNDIDL